MTTSNPPTSPPTTPPSKVSLWMPRILIGLGLVLLLFFGFRAVRGFMRFDPNAPRPPVETDVNAIREWMTIPHIARMYRIPEEELFQVVQVAPNNGRRLSLTDIANQTGKTADQVMAALKEKIAQVQRDGPPKPPGGQP